MINYDSILSAFDGKPTLLQWLKMVKKALDESILKNVNITQNGEKVVFSFNFEDGTSISTPEVTLPKGDKGDTGATGPKGDTGATGATGPKGDAGVSITGIDTVRDEVVENETLTTLRANYSNDTSNEFVVKAKNGKDAISGGSMYLHSVRIYNSDDTKSITFNVYSQKGNLTLEDALAQIPTSNSTDIHGKSKIPVCFDLNKLFSSVLGAAKWSDTKVIYLVGIAYSNNTNTISRYEDNFTAVNIEDKVLGVNL